MFHIERNSPAFLFAVAATIRTALNFFLSREMRGYSEKETRPQAAISQNAEGS